MKSVFLSHPHSSAEIAIYLSEWITDAFDSNVQVICTSEPKHNIDMGHMITTSIVEHIKLSKVVLVLITEQSLNLPWIFYEMGAAHALKKVFIPCVSGNLSLIDLPPQAYEYQGVQLYREAGLRGLVNAIEKHTKIRISKYKNIDYEACARVFR